MESAAEAIFGTQGKRLLLSLPVVAGLVVLIMVSFGVFSAPCIFLLDAEVVHNPGNAAGEGQTRQGHNQER